VSSDTEYWVRASLTFDGEESAWTTPVAAELVSVEKAAPEASPRVEKAAVAAASERRPRKRVWLKEEQKKVAIVMVFLLLSVVLAVILARAVTM
jgi:hypothetical protein